MEEEYTPCPHCGEMMPAKASRCARCRGWRWPTRGKLDLLDHFDNYELLLKERGL